MLCAKRKSQGAGEGVGEKMFYQQSRVEEFCS